MNIRVLCSYDKPLARESLVLVIQNFGLKKVSSKFGVYQFMMSSQFELVTVCFSSSVPTFDSLWLKVSIRIVQNKRIAAVN
jgi:hypothetical protein